jgi:hypothetical protein
MPSWCSRRRFRSHQAALDLVWEHTAAGSGNSALPATESLLAEVLPH